MGDRAALHDPLWLVHDFPGVDLLTQSLLGYIIQEQSESIHQILLSVVRVLQHKAALKTVHAFE